MMSDPISKAAFPTTHWSRVVAVGDQSTPEARAALAGLCADYWYPLYALVRRKGCGPDEAADVVQEYFIRLLESKLLRTADPRKGRFRSFLMADCSYFLAHRRARASARRRGGGRVIVPIDSHEAEGRFGREPAHELTAERLFERAWALTLLQGVLDRLRAEYHRDGRGPTFDALKVVLSEGPGAVPYAEIAKRLGTTEGAVQAAVHRLRRRYGSLVREQIAATVADPADVEDEIRELFQALGPG
jgi:RNA polymerase sigma-70 factor (ECF subfamily)